MNGRDMAGRMDAMAGRGKRLSEFISDISNYRSKNQNTLLT
jgi:hypothetical protein